jgi:hypothetical protein
LVDQPDELVWQGFFHSVAPVGPNAMIRILDASDRDSGEKLNHS